MRYTLMMFALVGVLHAQQPAGDVPPALPDQPPAVNEPAQPQPPAPGIQPAKPAIQQAGVQADLADKVIDGGIQEPTLSGDRIAELYREYTGKRVIVTRAAIAKQITFVQPGPLTYGEAADLLEKTALLEGLVFVPSGENEVKLVVPQNGKGFKVYTELTGLPEGDQMVTYVMSFKHIATDEAMKVFQTVVKQFHPSGSVMPIANTATLLITENTPIIRTLIQLKKQIDIPQEVFQRRTIYLENGDAEQVAEEVQAILDFSADFNVGTAGGGNVAPPVANNNGNNRPNNNNRSNTGRNASTAGENGVLVKAIPRNNSILIIARPIDIEYAMGIIQEFDRPSRNQNYYKRRLHFIAVSEFLDIAKNAIQRSNNSVSDEGGAGGGRNNRGNTNRSTQTPAGNSSAGQGGVSLSESERSEFPEDDLIGKTHIIAHNSINTIIVNGPPQSIKIIDDLISEMDVASEQVQITAIFGRYNLNGDLDFGIDFARTFQTTRGGNSSGFAVTNNTGYPVLVDPRVITGDLFNPDTIGENDFNPLAVGGLSIYGRIGEHFIPTLRAMESTGRFKVLAKPTVFTTNNKKAVLSSGQQIAVPTNTLSQNVGVGGGNVSQSTNIEFKDVLLKLEVIPLVNSKNEVTLRIAFKNDTVAGVTTIDGNDIPTISTEELVTSVTVPNKGTVVLGGLITERNSLSVSGVPVLSRIPGIGKLFSTERKSESRDELVIFIQPRIVSGPGSLAELQEYNRSQSHLAAELVPESGLLPPLPVDHSSSGKEPVEAVPQPVQRNAPSSSRFRGLRR